MAERSSPTLTEPSAIAGLYGDEPETPEDRRANMERFIRKLEWRRDHRKYVAVLVDGREPGVGKSTLAIYVSRRIDPEFRARQVAARGSEFAPKMLEAVATRKGGTRGFSMIVIDEPKDLMARGGRKDAELIQIAAVLGSMRKNGVGAVLVAPRWRWYDSLVRGGLLPYWLFVEDPGVARTHRAWVGPDYRMSQSRIPYDRSRLAHVAWPNLDRTALFREYEADAIRKNLEFAREDPLARFRKRSNGVSVTAAPPAAAGTPDPNPSLLTGPERGIPPRVPPDRPADPPRDWGAERVRCPQCGETVRRDALRRHRGRCDRRRG